MVLVVGYLRRLYAFMRFSLSSMILLIALVSLHYMVYANALDNGFNKTDSDKTRAEILESHDALINTNDVSVKEQGGALQSDELEVIDLFPENKVEEKLDYSHCADYYRQASVDIGGGLRAIRLKDGQLLGYSKTRPKIKGLIKYDPFIGLFLAEDKRASKYAYDIHDIDDYALTRTLASIGLGNAIEGRFKEHQKGFLEYAQFSTKTMQNGVISNICYKVYGLSVGGRGFIEKRYIDRFLSQERPYYGDIGVRFKIVDEDSATFSVEYADPFFPNNPLKRGDVLISINNIAPKDWAELEFLVYDLTLNSMANVKIRRNGEPQNFDVRVGRLHGSMLLADSFLERFSISISNDFVVQKAPSSGPFSKLRKGDKILFINHIDMRQFKLDSIRQKNDFFRELFTSIQGDQVDFLKAKRLEKKNIETKASFDKDILTQFQKGDVTKEGSDSFYRNLSESLEDFVQPDTQIRKNEPTNPANIDPMGDLRAFSGDEILRDSDTKSMRTIYDTYDRSQDVNKGKDKIMNYEELEEYGEVMTFLIDRRGFEFRVPLE